MLPSLKGRILLARSSVVTFPLISVALPRPFPPANMYHWLCDTRRRIVKHSASENKKRETLIYIGKYREHQLNCGKLFSHKGVASGKVDEDRVRCVRLQQSADDVVVLQPIVSER